MKWKLLYRAVVINSLALGIIAIPGTSLSAQTDIEIEVVGPWSYVAPPSDLTRIILMAPTFDDHQFLVHSGSDPEDASSVPLDDGIYKLDVGLSGCSTPTTTKAIKIYSVQVAPQEIVNAIAAKSGRFAISLPKPCWFETYDSARALIDSKQISANTKESAYTTWMVLHYTVNDSSQPATLTGTNHNGNQVNSTVAFSNNPVDSLAAVSIVLYNDSVATEDYLCDSHSAHYFDEEAHVFWGQTSLYYLFPELSSPGYQSSRYNYGKCNYLGPTNAMTMGKQSRSDLLGMVRNIQNDVKDGTHEKLKQAQQTLSSLKEELRDRWHDPLPKNVDGDLAGAAYVIEEELRRESNRHSSGAAILVLTEYLLTTGRIDCHAPQVDVNKTVAP